MTHHVNGGRPGRQARRRAQGSIGVSPVSRKDGWISANGCAAKFALQSFDHRPARQSGTQAGRLCYLGLGVTPPLGCRVVSPSEMSKLQTQALRAWLLISLSLRDKSHSPIERLALS